MVQALFCINTWLKFSVLQELWVLSFFLPGGHVTSAAFSCSISSPLGPGHQLDLLPPEDSRNAFSLKCFTRTHVGANLLAISTLTSSSSLSSFLSLPLSPIRSSSGTSCVRFTLLSSGGSSTWGMSNRDKLERSATCGSSGGIWERKSRMEQSIHANRQFSF